MFARTDARGATSFNRWEIKFILDANGVLASNVSRGSGVGGCFGVDLAAGFFGVGLAAGFNSEGSKATGFDAVGLSSRGD